VPGDGRPLDVQLPFFHFLNKEYQQFNQYLRIVVDGRNLAPAKSLFASIPVVTIFYTSQVAQNFSHQHNQSFGLMTPH